MNTKGICSFGNESCFIVEQAPRTQEIKFKTHPIEATFKVHMPYIYYCLTMQNNPISCKILNILTAKKPIYNQDSEVGYFPMPNMQHIDAPLPHMCLGEIRMDDGLEMHIWINQFLNKIVTSEYNTDLVFYTEEILPEIMKKAINEYGKKSLIEKDESPVAKALTRVIQEISSDYSNHWKYMYAWHKITENMTLTEFLKELTYPNSVTYAVMIEKLEEVVGEL